MRLNIRQLHALKNKANGLGIGIPNKTEGSDGDIRLQKTNVGVKLYGKASGQWYSFSPDTDDDDGNVLSVDDTKTIETNGFIKLTGGFIIQWGQDTAPANAYSAELDFPLAFPNKVCSLVGSKSTKHSLSSDGNDAGITYVSTSKYKVYSDDLERVVNWIALGN